MREALAKVLLSNRFIKGIFRQFFVLILSSSAQGRCLICKKITFSNFRHIAQDHVALAIFTMYDIH